MNLIEPKIDKNKLEKAIKEAQEKAYLEVINNFYTGYDSPYKHAIHEKLKETCLNIHIELPDILGKINEQLTHAIDNIANKAIANTYVPLIDNAFGLYPKNIKFSKILKNMIIETEGTLNLIDDYVINIEKNVKYDWYNVKITTPDNNYEVTFHKYKWNLTDAEKECKNPLVQLLGMPDRIQHGYKQKMTLYKDDIRLELPFTTNILNDKILNILFRLSLSSSVIELDVDSFDEDMFPRAELCDF